MTGAVLLALALAGTCLSAAQARDRAGEPAGAPVDRTSDTRGSAAACAAVVAEGSGGICVGGLLSFAGVATLVLVYGRVAAAGGDQGGAALPLLFGGSTAIWTASAAYGVYGVGEWLRTGRARVSLRTRSYERTLVFATAGACAALLATQARLYWTGGTLSNPRRGNGSWILAFPVVTVAFAIYGYETGPKGR